jgi:hypothetical protein
MAKFSDLNLLSVGNTIQIVGAIWEGDGHTYLCPFPEGKLEHPPEVLEMTLEEWQVFIHQTDVLDMEGLVQTPEGKVVKAIIRKSERQIAQGVSWRVYRRDHFRCRYCGRSDVPLTVDHLVLWEEGGPSTENNMVAADRRCNKTRGRLPYSQWLQHPYYKRVSAALTEEQRAANQRLLETLPGIPRMVHIRSR